MQPSNWFICRVFMPCDRICVCLHYITRFPQMELGNRQSICDDGVFVTIVYSTCMFMYCIRHVCLCIASDMYVYVLHQTSPIKGISVNISPVYTSTLNQFQSFKSVQDSCVNTPKALWKPLYVNHIMVWFG